MCTVTESWIEVKQILITDAIKVSTLLTSN